MFAGEDEDAGHGLTDYELERIAHIRRNREIMRRLGLGVHDIVSAARQRCGHDVPSSDASGGAPGKKKTSAGSGKKRPRAEGPAGENLEDGIRRVLRRSRRLAEKPEEAAGLGDDDDDENRVGREGDADALDFRAAAYSLDGDHEAEAEAYRLRNAGCQARVSVVGTASYQHTLMRVRTMGEDALFRRVKAIERAKGKHAVVKMRLFARVAFLEGLEAVADDAAASLERLVAELGDPEAEDEATGAETVNEKGEE
jgi:hypothetical protein